jgi:DNA-binding transcriptional regulator GbsR (MarR family)
MEKVLELLKRMFQMLAEKRWLKEIDKAVDRYKKAQSKANREYFVMKKLCERYNELYHRNLMEVKDGK